MELIETAKNNGDMRRPEVRLQMCTKINNYVQYKYAVDDHTGNYETSQLLMSTSTVLKALLKSSKARIVNFPSSMLNRISSVI